MILKEGDIGIITFAIKESGNVPLLHLVSILYSLSNNIYVVSGDALRTSLKRIKNIHTYGIRHRKGANVITRIVNYVCTQLRIVYWVVKIAKKVDFFVFFFGEVLLLPMVAAKLLKKSVILDFAASPVKMAEAQNDTLSVLLNLLMSINCILSDRIIVYSEGLMKEWGLQKHRNKISIAYEHFLDFNLFKLGKRLENRDKLVGYIGRLSEEKGIRTLLKAVSKLLQERDDIRFLIAGNGQLYSEVEQLLIRERINNKVRLEGWIPHNELSKCLNELKLLVLPSYTEGLPNIMLEAMASGTPVLATPVGVIPEIIRDGETGFIMGDNSPECIARNIIRALNYPGLVQVAQNAHAFVEREFTYKAAVERYRSILANLKSTKA